MFIKTQTESLLDSEIHAALETLANLEKTSEEYGKLVEHISKLSKLRIDEQSQQLAFAETQKEPETEKRFKLNISADTVLIVAANIFGILRITRYERENVVNSKSMGFIMKPR